ncbi:MAG: 23S rRNA (guanosine(2251)-2'-O)-methyltransferase RlmB, partial [Rhodocyclaceae bacterium]|nr:23S rRNA (guanosine(2251)-2'-O)-methyltransferase RlmB [Rhodocyclaceae bacterium]
MTDAARNTRLLYGFHAALSKLRRDAQAVRELYRAEQRQDARARDALALAQQHGIRVFHVDAARLDQLT